VMKKTHLVAGIFLWALFSYLTKSLDVLFLAAAVLASIAPDLDLRIKHRALLHNIFVLAVVAAGSWFLQGLYFAIIVSSAYFSHILLDSLTKAGVAVLFPLSSKRYGLRLVRNGGLADKSLCVLLTLSSVVLLLQYSKEILSQFLGL